MTICNELLWLHLQTIIREMFNLMVKQKNKVITFGITGYLNIINIDPIQLLLLH